MTKTFRRTFFLNTVYTHRDRKTGNTVSILSSSTGQ